MAFHDSHPASTPLELSEGAAVGFYDVCNENPPFFHLVTAEVTKEQNCLIVKACVVWEKQ